MVLEALSDVAGRGVIFFSSVIAWCDFTPRSHERDLSATSQMIIKVAMVVCNAEDQDSLYQSFFTGGSKDSKTPVTKPPLKLA